MMILDETPHDAAPREIQRVLVVAGVFMVLLAMLTTLAATRAGLPHLEFGRLSAVGAYMLPTLVHLASVHLTCVAATTPLRSRRRSARRALYRFATIIAVLNGSLMAAADSGLVGMLTAAVFGGLGPFFLAGLLDEEAGIWFTRTKAGVVDRARTGRST
ncbi:hypothetical protein [Nocardia sp. NRRL S-836]|uniref:hypothetical protein n=1 Tax=Nocardia sp. NRRL S-836 TaxID=1519492 RepID=UPI0006AF656E|nr:hypothetical protein [Nocardia sp. NRRL S-836]KOV87603.1 hypothetical protein ADL03_06840 [Nocardia sp. NRRL S-836]